MVCKDCELAHKTSCTFRNTSGVKICTLEYFICPLDEDDLYPGDYVCIDIKAYKKLLKEVKK